MPGSVEEVSLDRGARLRLRRFIRAERNPDGREQTFYKDGDIGDDGEWDNWRLEGPAFVWYFRGHPHVHIWINVADDPSVPLNAQEF